MDRIEFWLKSLVLYGGMPLDGLLASEVGYHTNTNPPEYSHEDLALTLESLFNRGDLLGYELDAGYQEGPAFVPNMQEVRDGLAGTTRILYGLTPQGGAVWESAARPDWNRYVFDGTQLDVPNNCVRGTIIAVNQDLAEQCLASKKARLLSQKWQVLGPWRVFYWKSLPKGNQVVYEYHYSRDFEPAVAQKDENDWLLQNGKWYTDPYEL